MLSKILILIAIVIAIFCVVVALQPAAFNIVRSATIAAPPSAVFPRVNDLHQWQAWSPYEKLDPAMKRSFEGPTSGVGASYAWIGNREVGEGRMTIIESRPGELIRMKLEFLKPFAATNTAEFTFKPEGGQTAMTWSLSGRNNFISKAVCMFMNMDKMVGDQFAEGLANLDKIVKTPAVK